MDEQIDRLCRLIAAHRAELRRIAARIREIVDEPKDTFFEVVRVHKLLALADELEGK